MDDSLWVALERAVAKSISRVGIRFVYEDALRRVRRPLIMDSTDSLIDSLVEGESIVIFTGFRTPPQYLQETDGPCGAAFLSKCLNSAGYRTHVLIEEDPISLNVVKAVLSSIGAYHERAIKALPPGGGWRADYEGIKIVTEINPSAAIFIEKPGPNDLGVYHSMKGIDVSKYHVDVDPIMSKLVRDNVVTVGIGDGGNEVGMGVVKDSIRKYVPYGNLCNCPCRGGIASALPTDHLIISGTSNLGAYALAAGIFVREGIRECLIGFEAMERMIRASVSAGSVDGITGHPKLSVDGYSIDVLRNFIKALRESVIT